MTNTLNDEEREILESFEKGEWQSTSDFQERKEIVKEYSRATLKKDKRVNIRISGRDLKEIQRKAIHEGLPYQTLISSILHKFVNGNLVERSSQA